MNRLSLTTAFSAILIFVAWLATPAMSQTDIVVEPTSYDFGDVPSGSVTVIIHNNGFSPYEITIEWQEGSSGDFTTNLETPFSTVLFGFFDDPQNVEITYTSSGPGISSATLLVSVSDLFAGESLQVAEVGLSGGVEETDPEINIDIKPGGNPNSINLKSKGKLPVAVLTDENFDASTIDPETVTFAGAEPVRWKMVDVDDDGDMDMLFHFETQDLELDGDSTEATLTIETDEAKFVGTDTVKIVPGSSRPSRAPGRHSGVASTWGKIKAK